MDNLEGESEVVGQMERPQEPLIYGLPDDITLLCLARVPREYHTVLKFVSRRWRELVHSEEWHTCRRKHNLDETWIYALCRDKFEQVCCYVLDPNSSRRCWKQMRELPSRSLLRKGVGFEVLGKKLYLLGGCRWSEDATDETYCYDAANNSWTEANPLSTARCYFACEVLDQKIYAIGGLGLNSSVPQSWDTFDPCMNSWSSHSDGNIIPEIEDSFVLGGKIYIRCGRSAVSNHVYAVVYEPSSGTWQHADADMISGWQGPAVVVDETLYVLDESSGTRLMMWDKDLREWMAIGRLSPLLTRPPCKLVAVGKSIYVIGKGRSTVVVDVSNAGNGGGMMKLAVQKVDSGGPFRLLQCASKGDKAGVIQELEKGVEPNGADYDRRTALHLASSEGWTEVVVLLLEKGADVNSLDRWGRTPLSDARSFRHREVCKILEARGGTDPVGVDSQAPCFEIDHSEVVMDEATLIGEGAYGEVYLVKWRGTEVAAKTIRSSIASNPKAKNTFLKELSLWQRLRHPNIVQFLGVLKHSDRLIFLTEYLRNGSLYDILKKKGRLDLQTAISYALDIARGMNYLHEHKPHAIIHRDLTPRNVLQDEAGRLKVTDFGLSKLAQEKDSYGYKMTGGTDRYMAPEVYRRESYGKSVDVFSFALILHEMLQGGPSNRAETAEEVADKRAYEDSRPALSSFIYPEPIKMLLKECWHKNPDCRPTFGDIILQLEGIEQELKNGRGMIACSSCVVL
ncbi:hypothetical protein V6N13_093491 [Hibiscus sabdariffa]